MFISDNTDCNYTSMDGSKPFVNRPYRKDRKSKVVKT